MGDNYTLAEVRVELPGGITVVAKVDSLEAMNRLLSDLAKANLSIGSASHSGTSQRTSPAPTPSDTPEGRMETRAELEPGTIPKLNLIAFKDNVPQLLRPGALGATDALLLLLFCVEAGLQTPKLDYESFKDLYEAQNIKSGSPLSMTLTNLRNSGYLDKKSYQTDRSLSLTAKGERKAIEILKSKRSS